MLPKAIIEVLEAADTKATVMPPTQLYNEGWMLRLVLALASRGVECPPLTFEPSARWFSEALLSSPFDARSRGDRQAEGLTNADGVIGHFAFTEGSKVGLTLTKGATQLVVVEAKMFSPLSRGTKNAPDYDQAARTVGCMAKTLQQASAWVETFRSLAFYVIAPRSQIAEGVFAGQMSKEGIRRKVQARVEGYDGPRRTELDAWLSGHFEPLLGRMELRAVAWEDLVKDIGRDQPSLAEEVDTFYQNVLHYSRRSGGR